MLSTYQKLFLLLDRRERLTALWLLLVMFATATVEMLSVFSIMPFLAVLADPSMVETNQWLNATYTYLGFEETRQFLFFLGISAFVILLVSAMVRALNEWVIQRFTHMRQYSISRRLMANYLSRPYCFFLSRNSSDLAKSVLEETSQIVSGALMPALRLVSFILIAIAILALLIAMEPVLAIAVAAGLGIVYGSIYLGARLWLQRIGRDRVAANRERFTAAGEAFAGAKEIRLLGREWVYLDRYRMPAKRFAKHQSNARLLSVLPKYAIEAIAFGGVLLIVLYLMSDQGSLAQALPVVGLYVMAGKKLIPAFNQIFQAITSIRFTIAAVDDVLDDLLGQKDIVPLPSKGKAYQPLVPVRSIEFHNITYRYPESTHAAIDSMDLIIPACSTVGLVGPSGSGKSTLIDLLLGLLDPESGQIIIDGVPLGSQNMRSWQAGIGYVPQHIFLADDTVRANIALGVPESDIDENAVIRAARMANLHDFIVNEMPGGYDSIIGEKGVKLSGGQRQRVGIARALYRDPPVLVLDEATSALDNATERAVMEAVHNLSHQKTIVIIAHRLSTVKPCDRIYVLESGRKVEEGTWEELTQEGFRFRKLAAGA